jgi:hypothetical protein
VTRIREIIFAFLLPVADSAAAVVTNSTSDQPGTDNLAEAAAGDHADARAERTACNGAFLSRRHVLASADSAIGLEQVD